jgi:hypothetical protein
MNRYKQQAKGADGNGLWQLQDICNNRIGNGMASAEYCLESRSLVQSTSPDIPPLEQLRDHGTSQ